MSFIIRFLLITHLTVYCSYGHPLSELSEEESSSEEYDYDENDDFIDMQVYLPKNTKKAPDGSSECCPVDKEDCSYLNITSNIESPNFTSLICVACSKANSQASLSWKGPNNTDIKQMTSVTSKDVVIINLQNSTFFMKEIIVSDEEYNGTEFLCILKESITVVRTIISHSGGSIIKLNNSTYFMKGVNEGRNITDNITTNRQLLLRHVLKV
ncbi:SWPV1-090 [Shearwaterpox virus]|uniref:SWPV1-090 n=1 Tax=Shearwaterpox virus TaxID=1974596 RepID=A0A1V0S7T7_CNPV|nr:SWPV1-090 [Shearwaterpox virus]